MDKIELNELTFSVVVMIDGVFNNPDAPRYTFDNAIDFLLALFEKTGNMPAFGDNIWADQDDKRFVVISRDYGVDDYGEIMLCVIPQEVYYQPWIK